MTRKSIPSWLRQSACLPSDGASNRRYLVERSAGFTVGRRRRSGRQPKTGSRRWSIRRSTHSSARSTTRTSTRPSGRHGICSTVRAWRHRSSSGAAFQKNRLSGQASVFSTLFEDDYVGWLLDRPHDVLSSLDSHLGSDRPALERGLRHRAFAIFRQLTSRETGYPRILVFQAYQPAALELIQGAEGELGEQAREVLDERFPHLMPGNDSAPSGFPGPDDAIGTTMVGQRFFDITLEAAKGVIDAAEPVEHGVSGPQRGAGGRRQTFELGGRPPFDEVRSLRGSQQ